MKVAAITLLTGNPRLRPIVSEWSWHQTRQPDLWLHACDFSYGRPDGSSASIGKRRSQKARIADNIAKAVRMVPKGHAVLFMEEDDYYLPNHVEQMVASMEGGRMVVANRDLCTYHVGERAWKVYAQRDRSRPGASTAFTGVHPDGRDELIRSMERCARDGAVACPAIWSDLNGPTPEVVMTGVGIKGIPGTGVVGKHRLGELRRKGHEWTPDPGMEKLVEWLGPAAEHYREFCR